MICIYYRNGRVLQGVVLAFGDRLVRVAVQGSDDTVEYRLVNQHWVSEDCEVVTLDFAEPQIQAAMNPEADLLETLIQFEMLQVPVQRVM